MLVNGCLRSTSKGETWRRQTALSLFLRVAHGSSRASVGSVHRLRLLENPQSIVSNTRFGEGRELSLTLFPCLQQHFLHSFLDLGHKICASRTRVNARLYRLPHGNVPENLEIEWGDAVRQLGGFLCNSQHKEHARVHPLGPGETQSVAVIALLPWADFHKASTFAAASFAASRSRSAVRWSARVLAIHQACY